MAKKNSRYKDGVEDVLAILIGTSMGLNMVFRSKDYGPSFTEGALFALDRLTNDVAELVNKTFIQEKE